MNENESLVFTAVVQLAAFNFIPAKFQSSFHPPPLTFSFPQPPLPAFSLFSGLLLETALVLLFSTLGGLGLWYVFWKYFKEKQKGSNFLLEYPSD